MEGGGQASQSGAGTEVDGGPSSPGRTEGIGGFREYVEGRYSIKYTMNQYMSTIVSSFNGRVEIMKKKEKTYPPRVPSDGISG